MSIFIVCLMLIQLSEKKNDNIVKGAGVSPPISKSGGSGQPPPAGDSSGFLNGLMDRIKENV